MAKPNFPVQSTQEHTNCLHYIDMPKLFSISEKHVKHKYHKISICAHTDMLFHNKGLPPSPSYGDTCWRQWWTKQTSCQSLCPPLPQPIMPPPPSKNHIICCMVFTSRRITLGSVMPAQTTRGTASNRVCDLYQEVSPSGVSIPCLHGRLLFRRFKLFLEFK